MHNGGMAAASGARTSDLVEQTTPTPTGPMGRIIGTIHSAGSRTADAPVTEPTAVEAQVATTRRRRSVAVAQFVAIDLVAASIGALVAYVSRFGVDRSASHAVVLLTALTLPLTWVGVAALNRGYDLRFAGTGSVELRSMARTFLHHAVVVAFVSYAFDLQIARGFLFAALPITLLLSWLGRYVARVRVRRLRRAGEAMNRVLAVGSAVAVQRLAESMLRDQSAGLHVVAACLPPGEAANPGAVRRLMEVGIQVVGDYDDVRGGVDLAGVRSVAVVAGDVGTRALRMISWDLEGSGADLIVSSGLTEVAHQRVHVQSVAGLPLLRVDQPTFTGFRRVVKGAFDRLVAAVALLLLSPLLIGVAAAVRLGSHGPAFYKQTRIGRNGEPFRMVKFRSMRVGADAEVAALSEANEAGDGLLFKIREDPRVTRVGKLLRRFSLDELPQLFNVLVGSMSLVGPRPPLPSEVAQYGNDVSRRLLVKPGLTGVWQISGRSDLSWDESVRLDLHYVENWSFAVDLAVIFKTVKVVVKATGAY
jgi:exopolysaccharide biosynthesis polyprenyl glycosylphosphotransferase